MKYVVEIDIIRAQLRSYVLYQVLLFANYGLWYKDVFWEKVFWEKLELIRLSWVMILMEESMSLWISPLLFTNLGRAGSIYDPQSSDKSISGDTPPTLVSCLESTQPFAWPDMPSSVQYQQNIIFSILHGNWILCWAFHKIHTFERRSIEEEKQLSHSRLIIQSEFKLIDNLVSIFAGWYLFI